MLNSTLIWGVFLILLGTSMILKVLFDINIPIFKGALAIFLIYTGISMITGKGVSFNSCKIVQTETKQYKGYSKTTNNSIFGSREIDLNQMPIPEQPKIIAVNSIFGSARIKLNPEIPTLIKIESAFGNVTMPDGKNLSFGDVVYNTHENSEPLITLEVNAVFGHVEIFGKKTQ